MKIRSVEFVKTVVDPGAPLPEGLPQIAFSGRSNVGKSSLINTILGRTRKKIAQVSGTPGKTRGLNFYRVNDRFFLVDLPGFGFARVPERVRRGWKPLVEGYLGREDGPVAVVHLVDARRDPTEDDIQMLDYLAGLGVPTLVAVTKVDKLSRSRRTTVLPALTRALSLDPEQVVPFSAKTGEGRDELLGALAEVLKADRSGNAGSTGRAPITRAAVPLLFLGVAGCGLLFPGTPSEDASPAPADAPPAADPAENIAAEDVPVGLGTLRQNEISMSLRRGELQIQVTPLDESIIKVTAPDTYERLSALGGGHQEIFRERTGSAVPFQLFLVSLYSESAQVAFEPEALNLVNRGLRYRPVEIRAVTPGWDSRLLTPRQTLMAVYAFTRDLDLEREVEVEYLEVRSREWREILPVVQRERTRLRSRMPIPN